MDCECCGDTPTVVDFYDTEHGPASPTYWCDDCAPDDIAGDERTTVRYEHPGRCFERANRHALGF